MKTFTDNEKRDWTVEINVAALKRVRGLTGVDLMDILGGSLIERLIRDPVLLCDVLYAACRPQAQERNLSDEDFGRAMAGDAIEHATAALLEELVSFCPSPRDRRSLGRVLDATRRVMDRARDLVELRIEGGELDRAIDAALEELPRPGAGVATETLGGSSGAAPASSASTPPT